MEKLLHVSSSPHIRSKAKTSSIMFLVVVALLPAACFGIWLNGPYAGAVLAVSIAASVLTEYIYEKLMRRAVTVSDGSAAMVSPVWVTVSLATAPMSPAFSSCTSI